MKRRLAPWICLLLVWSLLPMLWQLISSFSTAESLVNGSIPFQARWTLVHYKELLASDPPFWRYLLNSTIVSGLTTVITLALAIPAAYGLARVPQQLRRIVRWMTAAAALFPYVLLFLALLALFLFLGFFFSQFLLSNKDLLLLMLGQFQFLRNPESIYPSVHVNGM